MSTYLGKYVINNEELSVGSTLFGVCDSTRNTPRKVVNIADFDELIPGVTVHVKFNRGNAATIDENFSLQMGITTPLPVSNPGGSNIWANGAVISFTYDATDADNPKWAINDSSSTPIDISNTYDETSETAISGKGVKVALSGLDGALTGTPGLNKTLKSFNEIDGIVTAEFDAIAITTEQVTDFPTLGTVADKNAINTIVTGEAGNVNNDTIPTTNAIVSYVNNYAAEHDSNIIYAVCDTEADQPHKLVNYNGFSLYTGEVVHIKFTHGNTTGTPPTLNINDTGDIPIFLYGTTAAGNESDTTGWHENSVMTLVYDGNGWIRDSGNNTDTIYTHPYTSGYFHIPTGGQSGQILGWAADGMAQWISMSGNGNIGGEDIYVNQEYSVSGEKYPLLFSNIANITTQFDRGAASTLLNNNIHVQPSTGTIYANKFNDYILSTASAKDVDENAIIDTESTNLPTSQAVATYVGSQTITIAGRTVNIGGVINDDELRVALSLSNALHFLGILDYPIISGSTADAGTINGQPISPQDGDVVIYETTEYVWANHQWNLLGDESIYKIKQEAVTDPTAVERIGNAAITYIDGIIQNENGEITVSKKDIGIIPILYGGTGTNTQTANRMVYSTLDEVTNSVQLVTLANHYVDANHVAIKYNSNSTPTYTFYVNGTTYLGNDIDVRGNIIPTANGVYNIGDTQLKWKTGFFSDSIEIEPDYEHADENKKLILSPADIHLLHGGYSYTKMDISVPSNSTQSGKAILTLGNSIEPSVSGEVIENELGEEISSYLGESVAGYIRIYGRNSHYIQVYAISNNNNDTNFILPPYNDDMYAVHTESLEAVGGETVPVYINVNGRVTAFNTTIGSSNTNTEAEEYGTAQPLFMNEGALTAITANIGSQYRGLYSNDGVLTALQYYLKADVNYSTEIVGDSYISYSNRLAYYSAVDAISSGLIVTNGEYLDRVKYIGLVDSESYELYDNLRLYAEGSVRIIDSEVNSIDIDTGALVVDGGVGISGDVNIGKTVGIGTVIDDYRENEEIETSAYLVVQDYLKIVHDATEIDDDTEVVTFKDIIHLKYDTTELYGEFYPEDDHSGVIGLEDKRWNSAYLSKAINIGSLNEDVTDNLALIKGEITDSNDASISLTSITPILSFIINDEEYDGINQWDLKINQDSSLYTIRLIDGSTEADNAAMLEGVAQRGFNIKPRLYVNFSGNEFEDNVNFCVDGTTKLLGITTINATSNNEAVNSTTHEDGALIVTGGVGIGKDVNIKGYVGIGTINDSAGQRTGENKENYHGRLTVQESIKIVYDASDKQMDTLHLRYVPTNSDTSKILIYPQEDSCGYLGRYQYRFYNAYLANQIVIGKFSGDSFVTGVNISSSAGAGATVTFKIEGQSSWIQSITASTGTFVIRDNSDTAANRARIIGYSANGWAIYNRAYINTTMPEDPKYNFFVTGSTELNGTALITGNTTINGIVSIKNTTDYASNTEGALVVAGGATIKKKVHIVGDTEIDGILHVTNNTDSTSSGNGAIFVDGGVGIAKQLQVGSNANITGTLTVTGATTLKNTLRVNGAATLDSTLTVAGITTINSNTDSNSTSSGALIVAGGVGIGKDVYIGQSLNVTGNSSITGNLTVTGTSTLKKQVSITCTDPSESKTTGALVVSGGVGIGKDTFIGGALSVTGNFTLGGALTITNTTDVNITNKTASIVTEGGVYIAKKLYVGSTATTHSLTPNEDATFNVGTSSKRYQNYWASGGYYVSADTAYTGNADVDKAGSAFMPGRIELTGDSNAYIDFKSTANDRKAYTDYNARIINDALGCISILGATSNGNNVSDSNTNYRDKSLGIALRVAKGGLLVEGEAYSGDGFTNIATSKTTGNGGFKVMVGSATYLRLYMYAAGTESTTGQARLVLGNAITSGNANNAYGSILMYQSNDNFVTYGTTSWTGHAASSYTFVGTQSTAGEGGQAGTTGSTTLIVGKAGVSRGYIRIYGSDSNGKSTYIVSDPDATGGRYFHLPPYAGVMYAVHTGGTSAVGGNTQPVYIADNGRATALTYTANRLYYSASDSSFAATSCYASTTAVTINGTSAPANSGKFQVVGTSTMRHILPEANDTYNLGNSGSLRWKCGYFTSALYVGTLNYTGSDSGNPGTSIGVGAIELVGSTPYIDFHYANSTANYDVRLYNNTTGCLYVYTSQTPTAIEYNGRTTCAPGLKTNKAFYASGNIETPASVVSNTSAASPGGGIYAMIGGTTVGRMYATADSGRLNLGGGSGAYKGAIYLYNTNNGSAGITGEYGDINGTNRNYISMGYVKVTTIQGSFIGNASTATKWAAAQKVYVTLGTASTTTTIQGGSTSAQTIGVDGTLKVANGGTGKTTGVDACNYFINCLSTGTDVLTSNDYVITQYVGGGTTTTTYHRRAAKNVRVGGLLTPRTLTVSLSTVYNSDSPVQFDGTANKTLPITGVLGVAHGGTGKNAFTANCVIMSGTETTSAFVARAVTNNTTAGSNPTANANIITANTLINYKGTTNITTLGTIASGTWNATTIGVAYGGTGKKTWTVNGIIYASAATTLAQIAAPSNGKVLSYANSAYSWLTYASTNTAGTLVYRNSSGNFTAGTITASLTGNVTGNADTATRIKGNLSTASGGVGHNLWVSSTASNDGIPRYISGLYCTEAGYLYSNRVYNAYWNDYAEYRAVETDEPGYCVTETSSGTMIKTYTRLQAGCKITSDTFGACMGETSTAKTPIAVAGRVLVYPYRAKEEYQLGAAVCSAPNGTVDIMTRDEIMMYPERIVGTVSEIPTYDIWKNANSHDSTGIEVKGRIWIYVR